MLIQVPDLVVDNVASSGGLPSVVAPTGILHLLRRLARLRARSFRRVGVSSRKNWSGDGVHRSSPASMGDSEPAIMSDSEQCSDE